jgi:hypothetical protein
MNPPTETELDLILEVSEIFCQYYEKFHCAMSILMALITRTLKSAPRKASGLESRRRVLSSIEYSEVYQR